MENKLLVLITTYSRGFNLPAVVESVVNQTFKNYKILICDDCSPNDPTEIINGIKSKYPNVNIESYRNPINVGEGININVALGREFHNNFKYLVLLQDDTVYLDKNFLEMGIQLLEQNPDAAYFAGMPSSDGINYTLFNTQGNSNILTINGIDLWRIWFQGLLHWAACIFKFNDIVKYRLSLIPRKDVANGDALMLLRLAMKNYIIIFNRLNTNLNFNKNGGGYEERLKYPIKEFVDVEKYFKLASESAVEHGAGKAEADNWLLNHQIKLAFAAINRIGNNKELREEFMNTLMNYDERIALTLLNTAINSLIR